jgi:hypothetical protein
MKRLLMLIFTASLLAPSAIAQFDPEGAQVISYFPHLADGGPRGQQWTTSLTFVNPHLTLPANATAYLYGDGGSPLSLNFGAGAVSTFTFTVPPQGTVTFTSTAASATTVTGWAFVSSTMPLQGVTIFRFAVNGVAQQGVAAEATAPSSLFRSPATPSTGIAVANIYPNVSVPLTFSLIDQRGVTLGASSVTVPALGHQSFTVSQLFPNLPSTFHGTILAGSASPGNDFVAWTVSGEGGTLVNYPPAGLAWPVSQWERIWKVWQKVLNYAGTVYSFNTFPQLVIDYTTTSINSYADPAHNQVHIFINLAELISDSDSELGFVVAHEIGHVIQARVGLALIPTNIELDADQYGLFLSIGAGYDPYGAAGALAKLYMASGQAGLVAQNFDNLSTDPHGSFNNRLALIFSVMQAVCSTPQSQNACSQYKNLVHPHLPAIAPLMVTAPKPK